jgi:L,D-peptidoglycan transpeptidase YkuD (ErfK/YbiS/YcfS/YnhG family)
VTKRAILLCLWIGWFSTDLLPAAPQQLIVATAPDTESYQGQLRLFSRPNRASAWKPDSDYLPALYGRHGLAWGRGLHPRQTGRQKKERDGRAPAGRFNIGLIIGNEATLPPGARWTPYLQKTDRVAWVDEPALESYYNRLFILQPGAPTPVWFERHRMKLNDPAYHWLVVVEHNYPHPQPGAGSAIFLHVRRGETRPSAGCTVMAHADLERLILWLRPEAKPEFVLLSRPDYVKHWQSWNLPAPALAFPATLLN